MISLEITKICNNKNIVFYYLVKNFKIIILLLVFQYKGNGNEINIQYSNGKKDFVNGKRSHHLSQKV